MIKNTNLKNRVNNVQTKFMHHYSSDASKMKTFLNDYKIKYDDKITNSNIIQVCGNLKSKYYIEENIINGEFFNKLNNLYKKGINMGLAEKQNPLHSGILLDFDLYQHNSKSMLDLHDYCSLVKLIFQPLFYYGDFSNYQSFSTHVGILKRPTLKYDDNKKIYKDGFHILIPKVHISKHFKRLIIKKIKEIDTFKSIFKSCKIPNNYKYDDILDNNSSYVPTFFIGQDREFKNKSGLYKLEYVIEFKSKCLDNKNINAFNTNNVTDEFMKLANLNIVNEFSLNWESKQKYIKLEPIRLKTEYIQLEINEIKENNELSDEICDSLSCTLSDKPIILELRELLKIIPIKFFDDYQNWITTIIALKNYDKKTYPIAYELTAKVSDKRTKEFNEHWNSIKKRHNGKSVTINTIHYFAMQQAPKKYKLLLKDMALTKAIELAMNKYLLGKLGHTDYADIVYRFNRFRYKSVRDNSKNLVWYGFIDENNLSDECELYKWKKYDSEPSILREFITTNGCGLKKILENLIDQVTNTYSNADEQYKKWYGKLKLNLMASLINLSSHTNVNSIMKELIIKFEDERFAKKLDSYDNLIGVGNGILDLKKIKLLTGWHGKEISRKTEIKYVTLNPYDEKVKEFIISLRNIFPNNESDSFEFIMSYLASSLKGGFRKPKILILTGAGANGKSTLLEFHRLALGEYARKIPTQLLTGKNNNPEGATPQLACLLGMRFAYCSETNQNECANMAKIKEIVGGEVVSVRKLYSEPFLLKPEATIALATNNLLDIVDSDWGTWRRILLCMMRITFVNKPDPNKKNERKANDIDNKKNDPKYLQIYLSLIVYFYARIQKIYGGDYMKIPHPHIENYTKKYQHSQNKVEKFIYENCTINKNNVLLLKNVINNIYKNWYKMNYNIELINNESIKKSFINSVIEKYISFNENINDYVIKGLEFNLDNSESKNKVYLKNLVNNNVKNIKHKKRNETSEQYYKRFIKEFEEFNSKYELFNINNVNINNNIININN